MPTPFDWLMLLFLFALGASVGSFLNVVVLRLPEIELPENLGPFRSFHRQLHGLSYPPSHCPKCNYQLRWYDNFPVFGWVWLRGKCRQCKLPISPRYPLTEALVGLIFAGFYASFFLLGPAWGPPTPAQEVMTVIPTRSLPAELRLGGMADTETLRPLVPEVVVPPGMAISDVYPAGVQVGGNSGLPVVVVLRQMAQPMKHWPMLVIVLVLAWSLTAASLIDAGHFYIPRWLSYLPAIVGLALHTVFDEALAPLSLMVGPVGCAWAIGGGVGLLISLALLKFGLMRQSFAEGMPMLESEREAAGHGEPTAEEWIAIKRLVRREMLWEVLFLAIPIGLGLLCAWSAAGGVGQGLWQSLGESRAISAFCGSLLGGLIGGGVIWIVRVAGSLGFGREAMGLGDADLMFGVGCCLGAGAAGLALFPAAVIGLVFAIGRLIVRARHELPFGPYLAIASLLMVLGWNHVADFFRPTLSGLAWLLGPAAPLVGLGGL